MHHDAARAHAHYNRWMNEKLYALAAELTPEQRTRDLGAFFGSLQKTLLHLIVADRIWLARFAGTTPTQDPTLEHDFAKMREARATEDERLIKYVDALDDEKLSSNFAYTNLRGDPFEHPLWYAVLHMFNHQTHHRGQATTLLVQLGKDPGVTDLIAFLRLPNGPLRPQKGA
jgi:uncharacterized damage-inducible protein DinB